jgi:uncharacterized protein
MAKDANPRDQIGYDGLTQEALRGVVRQVLKRAATKGLPGDHHFYITFRTTAPGVTIPKELAQQYPEEMMIVLQHQFWELAPQDASFSVTLRFGGQPKSLSVPYAAITQFSDPSVDFRLSFAPPEPAPRPQPAPQPVAAESSPPPPAPRPRPPERPSGAANIVSLDQFRKK